MGCDTRCHIVKTGWWKVATATVGWSLAWVSTNKTLRCSKNIEGINKLLGGSKNLIPWNGNQYGERGKNEGRKQGRKQASKDASKQGREAAGKQRSNWARKQQTHSMEDLGVQAVLAQSPKMARKEKRTACWVSTTHVHPSLERPKDFLRSPTWRWRRRACSQRARWDPGWRATRAWCARMCPLYLCFSIVFFCFPVLRETRVAVLGWLCCVMCAAGRGMTVLWGAVPQWPSRGWGTWSWIIHQRRGSSILSPTWWSWNVCHLVGCKTDKTRAQEILVRLVSQARPHCRFFRLLIGDGLEASPATRSSHWTSPWHGEELQTWMGWTWSSYFSQRCFHMRIKMILDVTLSHSKRRCITSSTARISHIEVPLWPSSSTNISGWKSPHLIRWNFFTYHPRQPEEPWWRRRCLQKIGGPLGAPHLRALGASSGLAGVDPNLWRTWDSSPPSWSVWSQMASWWEL